MGNSITPGISEKMTRRSPLQLLPIYEKKDVIVEASAQNQVVVVAGETASGKSTQLPLFFLSDKLSQKGAIAVTQPRRIAAISLAGRVAEQIDTPLGERVGYKIRFDEKTSENTEILYMTDGILLTEIQKDPLLKRYSVIIVDEAHERSLNIDFLLGYIRKILPSRPDLKVIISSATIDTQLFAKAFDAPVVEVSGRLYPVDVLYMPPEQSEQSGDGLNYVDAAVDAVEQIVSMGEPGDILVFMPTERDILETQERLNGRPFDRTLILPLFGRLSRSRQHRIFDSAPGGARKVVIATNIAETSITVPGIRFVVDTGLARISRYSPNLRTSRLPIEPISRASADQRKGRCGRVSNGMCIRLYSEEEYLGRQDYTIPEIKRSNLAGVILQMISMRLGEIDRFPFLEPPVDRAIKDGYALLTELGAVDKNRQITPLGRRMARLPLDPHIARMVLEAKNRNALREVMIIAAGLSIVDPRERPLEQQEQADAAHGRFSAEDSDFYTYVRLWDLYQDEWKRLSSQTKMRRFCKEHFLSFNRMREWHDVHEQVKKIVYAMKGFRSNSSPAGYDEIHMSLLAGLLTNVAMRKEDGSGYRAARGREVRLFPGSVLFKKRPQWIMCHEIVETSRVFARTAALIQPHWLEQLAPALCRYTYGEPWFNEESGIVQAAETVLLFGLPVVKNRRVNFGRKKRKEAAEIFIYEGLVEQRLRTPHPFFRHNKKLRESLECAEAKLRRPGLTADDDTIAAFYRKILGEEVTSVHELNRYIRHNNGNDRLMMSEEDVLIDEIPQEIAHYPDHLTIAGKNFQLSYSFEPGRESDGITAHVPVSAVPYMNEETFGWLIRPLWPAKIHALLTQLPKSVRKKLMPLKERSRQIADEMVFSPQSFISVLCQVLRAKYGIITDPAQFDETALPANLRMRIDVRDKKNRSVEVSRDTDVFNRIRNSEENSGERKWEHLFAAHERKGISTLEIDDIPRHIEVGANAQGLPLFGYPALTPSKECVNLLLYSSAEEAGRIHIKGVRTLLEIVLKEKLAWLEKDFTLTTHHKMACVPFGGAEHIRAMCVNMMKNYVLEIRAPVPRTGKQLRKCEEKAGEKARGLAFETLSALGEIFRLYSDCGSFLKKQTANNGSNAYAGVSRELKSDLQWYMESCLSGYMHQRMFIQYPRYLQTFRSRIEKAFMEPAKYKDRAAVLQEYQKQAYALLRDRQNSTIEKQWLIQEYAEMVEEFGISLFAPQRVKTRFPVSEKRLNKMKEKIEEA